MGQVCSMTMMKAVRSYALECTGHEEVEDLSGLLVSENESC